MSRPAEISRVTKETTIRVAKSRYGSEIGVPGEITVVWDERRTRFATV